MVRRRLLVSFIFLFFVACRSPKPTATVVQVVADDASTVIDVRFLSESIGGQLWYRVIVPKLSASEELPVLYLLHGINSDPVEIMERSDVQKLASTHRLIVVMPEGGFSYYVNAKYRRHSRWEDAITRELMPDVETRFPLLKGREHTGIAGISMGGYGAVSLTLKHPDLYGFVGTMSGALDITRRDASLRRWGQTWRIWTIFGVQPSARRDEDVFDLLGNSTRTQTTRWFESCGQNDPLLEVNRRFERQLRQRGVDIETLETPGAHDWRSWNAAMPKMFASAERALR